jgi:ureidoacrylate peracid hydrolase
MIKDKGFEATMKRMLTTLCQKVDPSHTAILVVDTQHEWAGPDGYMAKEGYGIEAAKVILPKLKKLLDNGRKAGVPIIIIGHVGSSENEWYHSDVFLEHFQRTHKGAYVEYPVCEKGSSHVDFMPEVQPLPGDCVVYKHRYSAFVNTDLDIILRSKGIRTVIVSGMATDVCSGGTARDAFYHNYYVVFLKDCNAGTTEEAHNRECQMIDQWFGEVVDSSEVFKCWENKVIMKS